MKTELVMVPLVDFMGSKTMSSVSERTSVLEDSSRGNVVIVVEA